MRYLIIRTENLGKTYGRKQALANITLHVEPGEIFGLLGPKGAGKSTLVQILVDVVRPTRGSALVMGLDCQRSGLQVRRMIGYLPEKLSFSGRLTGIQTLNQLAALRKNVDWALIADLAAQFNLDLHKLVSTYSPAERQKLGLIQAFMHRPDLLILDNPSQNLDVRDQNTLYRLVCDARAEGRTVVIAGESLLEMERVCDRVAILHHGNLLAVERGVQLRSRALRKIEMRFAIPVTREMFAGLPNLNDLALDENKLRCTIQGDPDALIKVASQYRIMDFISQQPSLDEVYQAFYGVSAGAS